MEVNEITLDSYGWYFKRIFTSNEKIMRSIVKDIHKELLRLKGMVEDALKPFMKIARLKRSLSTCRHIALDLEKALVPSFDFFSSLPISEMVKKNAGAAGPDGLEDVKYIVVMTRAGWPPLFDIPIEFIRFINRQYQELGRDAFRSFAAKRITGLYGKKSVEAMGKRWSEKKKLALRFRFLKDALAAHNGRRYDLSIPTLVTELEGLPAKINGRTGKLKPEQFKPYVDSLFSGRNDYLPLKGMIIDGLYKNITWGDAAIPSLSRYAMLHGTAVDGGLHEISLKLILILDMLVRLL
jgi:hypothetical protein